jgi:hypothetical protein
LSPVIPFHEGKDELFAGRTGTAADAPFRGYVLPQTGIGVLGMEINKAMGALHFGKIQLSNDKY